MTRKETGLFGEAVAASHLEELGWQVLERNFHSAYGEIDIIACDARYVLFVEVKTRAPASWGTPAQAVDANKRRRLLLTAQEYLAQVPLGLQPRFDVCEVYLACVKEGQDLSVSHINYIQNAF